MPSKLVSLLLRRFSDMFLSVDLAPSSLQVLMSALTRLQSSSYSARGDGYYPTLRALFSLFRVLYEDARGRCRLGTSPHVSSALLEMLLGLDFSGKIFLKKLSLCCNSALENIDFFFSNLSISGSGLK